jgi:adenosylcobinamide-GDP ribazoletransferase
MKAALQYLTVLPVRRQDSGGFGAAWFPVVGALLGVAAAWVLGLPQGPLLCVMVLATITGGLHEDGVADVCDALRANRTRERMLAILHDSRIGAHGTLALVIVVLLRWQALAQLIGEPLVRLPAALAFARGTMVLLAAWTPAVGEGMGAAFRRSLTRPVIAMVLLQCGVASTAMGWRAGLWNLGIQCAIFAVARAWFLARLGGVNGDCLGFQCQASEAATLVLLTWA